MSVHNLKNFINISNSIKKISNKVNIIAVTKTFPLEIVRPLIDYGHLHYGENQVLEAINKWSNLLKNNNAIKLHMIGHLQSNKVKEAVSIFSYIHSLDSEKLASKISFEQNKIKKSIKLFIQVNIGNENQKNGIRITEVSSFLKLCIFKYKLDIVGLMCIPPVNQDPSPYFNLLKELALNNNLSNLSMGMSGDYLKAIKCGSSYVRIGSAIFGKRN